LEVGVDSVMVDGSAMPYEDNLAFTRRMVQLAQVMSRSLSYIIL
jgi:fructose/tagatose bisphosphate aldolase